MKQAKLSLLVILFFLNNLYSHSLYAKTLYIMLNIDYTILDRTIPCDAKNLQFWHNKGFQAQEMLFQADENSSASFLDIYEYAANNPPGKEASFLQKIHVSKVAANKFAVTECVVLRPTITWLLQQLVSQDIPTKILLTSRNDDARTNNLQKNLNLKVKNQTFQDITTFIPRNWFRIKTSIKSVKSAKLLRDKYALIKDEDYIVILDHIALTRFIPGDRTKDLHINISRFKLKNNYDLAKDETEMQQVMAKIKQHISKH